MGSLRSNEVILFQSNSEHYCTSSRVSGKECVQHHCDKICEFFFIRHTSIDSCSERPAVVSAGAGSHSGKLTIHLARFQSVSGVPVLSSSLPPGHGLLKFSCPYPTLLTVFRRYVGGCSCCSRVFFFNLWPFLNWMYNEIVTRDVTCDRVVLPVVPGRALKM